MPATLSIALVGPPAVSVDGAPLVVDTRKAVALLAYLAVTRRPASRDVLAGLLWPDTSPDRARSALRRTLSTLRSGLGDRWVETDRDVVVLAARGVTLDLSRLQALVADVRAHDHRPGAACTRCLSRLDEAIGLARGGFMEGFALRDSPAFEDWQQLVADDVDREIGAALELLADAQAVARDHPAAVATARRRLALQPLHEPAHRQLIRLLAESGDRAGALEQYRECVRALDRELGVHPLEETSALYHAILEGGAAPPDEPPARPDGATTASAIGPYPLVGRSGALAALTGLLEAITTDGRLAVVLGEAGIGKSRLAEELLALTERQGRAGITARCFPHEAGLAYAVVAELGRAALAVRPAPDDRPWWADEVARILPELGTPPPGALDGVAAQSRFYEAVCALLVEAATLQGPGVVVVDDLHWADEASLRLLGYLARRLRERAILLVVTWRDEEVGPSHAVTALEATARGSRDHRVVALERLSRADVEELVRASGRDPRTSPDLYRRSGGLPFFLVEYLEALGSTGGVEPALPGGVRELISARIASLGDLAGQVVSAGAVLGRGFDVETVRDTSGRTDDEIVGALEELIARGVLIEAADGSYDFRHEQTRDVVYDGLTRARRRLLHRRAAVALSTRARGHAQTASVARHHELGGEEPEAAALYHLAGDRARALYANAEALALYRSALALGAPRVAELHGAIGDLLTLAGDYRAALVSYETAAAHADAEVLPELEHRIGGVHLRRGDWELADAAFAAAVAALPEERAARALADRSLAAHRRGREADAEALAHQALTLAERTDDQRALAQAHNLLGMLAQSRGETAAALAALETSLEHARAAADPEAEVAALNNLALAATRAGDGDRGLELIEAGLALCVRLGDRHREAALRNNRADLLHRAGREQEAMATLKEAVAIFAELGEDARSEPELWKLSEW